MDLAETEYQHAIAALAAKGVRAEFHNRGQLVLPSRIWITWQDHWYVSTWVPAVYPVPDDVDIVDLCLACLSCESNPFYTIPDAIAQRFKLVRLDDNATDKVLAAM